jgi:hypothetical protein
MGYSGFEMNLMTPEDMSRQSDAQTLSCVHISFQDDDQGCDTNSDMMVYERRQYTLIHQFFTSRVYLSKTPYP